jgi:hypothetical protein
MSRLRALAFVALTLAAAAVSGCAGTDGSVDDGTSTGAGEDEIRSALMGRVAAVRFNGGVVVAAPGKLSRVLDGVGLGPRTERPPEGGLRCPPSYQLEFLDTHGVVKATAGFMCSTLAVGARKDVQGSVLVNGKSYLVTARDVDALDQIAAEPAAIGDLLFAVDRVQIAKPGLPDTTETHNLTLVGKIVRSISADQVPDPYARMARCLPSRALTFFRGADAVATASFSCGGDAEHGVVGGSFSGRDQRTTGGITIDAGVVFDVEQSLVQP